MPLSLLQVGETSVIQKVTGKDEVRQRLAELGFVVGAQVEVVNKLGENMILSVLGGRVALDHTMTSRIMV